MSRASVSCDMAPPEDVYSVLLECVGNRPANLGTVCQTESAKDPFRLTGLGFDPPPEFERFLVARH